MQKQQQQQQHRNQLRLSQRFTKFFLLFNELRKFYHIFAAASNLSQRFSFLSLSLFLSLSVSVQFAYALWALFLFTWFSVDLWFYHRQRKEKIKRAEESGKPKLKCKRGAADRGKKVARMIWGNMRSWRGQGRGEKEGEAGLCLP